MSNQKIHLKTIGLMMITVIFIGAIFYLSIQLRQEGNSSSLPIQRIKTKAAARSYTKLIVLNDVSPTPSSESNLQLTPSPNLSPSPTESLQPSDSPSPSLTPSPTDIIIAKNNISPSASDNSLVLTETVSPTRGISQLPETGYVGYSLAIFGSALTIILFALIL